MTLFKLPTFDDDDETREDETKFVKEILTLAKVQLNRLNIEGRADVIREEGKYILQAFDEDLEECLNKVVESSKSEFKTCVHKAYDEFKNSLWEFRDELSYDGQEQKETLSEFDTSSVSSSTLSTSTLPIGLLILLISLSFY
jgi:hypothetical protein